MEGTIDVDATGVNSAQSGNAGKRQRGFTLVELMIVVAIIGILASIGIPQMLRFVRQAETSDATQNMAALVQTIQAMVGPYGTNAQVATRVNGKSEDSTIASPVVELSTALAPLGWTVRSGTKFNYKVAAQAQSGNAAKLDICILATAGTTSGNPAKTILYSSEPAYTNKTSDTTLVSGWSLHDNTVNYVMDSAMAAGGNCTVTGTIQAAP